MNVSTLAQDGRPISLKGDASLQVVTINIPIHGYAEITGGPWSLIMFMDPGPLLDAVNPPLNIPAQPDLVFRLDGGCELWTNSGYFYRGLGTFRRLGAYDRRTGVIFAPLNPTILLSNDPDTYRYLGSAL